MGNYKNEIILLGAIIFSIVFALILKYIFTGIKKPNGKKAGIASLQIMVAVAMCTIAILLFKIPVLTASLLIMTLFLIKTKYSCNQYNVWQIIFSIILGVSISLAIIHVSGIDIKSIIPGVSTGTEPVREYMSDRPNSARDDRSDADSVPELRLDDE